MKYGNFVVLQMKPYEEDFGCFYSVAKETWYGVFEMKPYNKGIGVKDTVEKSYKVDLIAALSSKDIFPSRSWYTDIFTCNCYNWLSISIWISIIIVNINFIKSYVFT